MKPNDPYMSRTAPLTSKRYILYIYSTNIGTEYFKHALYSPFFSLQNAVYFIMLTCLVHVLFTFYIQDVLKLKHNNSDAKGLIEFRTKNACCLLCWYTWRCVMLWYKASLCAFQWLGLPCCKTLNIGIY